MEILSDILKSLRVSGSVYFCSQVEAPWTKEFNGSSNAGFHMVRRGHCWATVGDRTELLGPGDLIFIGPGIDHVLTSEQPIGESAATSDSTLLLCGYCSFDDDTLTPLKSIFPQRTIVREEELHQHPWLKSTFDQLSAEYMAQNPGTELIVNKLTEVVLIELIPRLLKTYARCRSATEFDLWSVVIASPVVAQNSPLGTERQGPSLPAREFPQNRWRYPRQSIIKHHQHKHKLIL